ncbi:hypothetical protein O181_076689 [Austropuccinia psidii MF-1]|uniref:Uncharacterized protein n=1 Tax=Austropuccinia psidii MF-1 TaxID=1389203 RepID=A0A9Q3FDH3_9BASI|nr:hypothetical protein [Austropuccinia psidii MF-1]
MTNLNVPSSSQQPNLELMLLTWNPNILFIIKSFRKQDFKLEVSEEYDANSHIQCQPFTTTSPTSSLTPPLYPAVFCLSSKKKLIKLPSGSDLPMMTPPHSIIKDPSSLIKKLN